MPKEKNAVILPCIEELRLNAGSKTRDLAACLRRAIENGALRSGDRLPSTRSLAVELGLARGTVAEVYGQLTAEGCLVGCVGSGTRVAEGLVRQTNAPVARNSRINTMPEEPYTARGKGDSGGSPAASSKASFYAERAHLFAPLPSVPFSVAVPGAGIEPDHNWRRLGNRIRAVGAAAPAGYEDPRGAWELREAIADYARKARAVVCGPENVLVTGGIQQGLFLAARVLLEKGQGVWAENPAYPGLMSVLEDAGLKISRIPVDGQGLNVSQGIRACPAARAAFVTPSHQFPLGMVMSMRRRMELLSWAQKNGAWVVEDDYDSELRCSGRPFPSLQGQDPERVIYLGTLSKVLFPSLRVGYAIVPASLVSAFAGARTIIDKQSPTADQHVLAAYMREGFLAAHVRRIRKLYAARRDMLLGLVSERLGDWLTAQPGEQGMHMVVWLPPHTDDLAVAEASMADGIALRPVSPLFAPATGRPGLMLGYGGFDPEHLKLAVEQLRAVLLRVLG